jgi:hypothetical protein
MKTIVVLAVSIVLVGILFCPMVMSVPRFMPDDLQMVQPDPSLPKELSAFFGKWESVSYPTGFFIIVEKIDEEKANLYTYFPSKEGPPTWTRREAKVIKERGKYKLLFLGTFGKTEYTLKGEYLVSSSPAGIEKLRLVP